MLNLAVTAKGFTGFNGNSAPRSASYHIKFCGLATRNTIAFSAPGDELSLMFSSVLVTSATHALQEYASKNFCTIIHVVEPEALKYLQGDILPMAFESQGYRPIDNGMVCKVYEPRMNTST